jgi:hypothetical protein
MTTYRRLADVQGEIFETRVTNGCFTQKQTLAKIEVMSELRDQAAVRLNDLYGRL